MGTNMDPHYNRGVVLELDPSVGKQNVLLTLVVTRYVKGQWTLIRS